MSAAFSFTHNDKKCGTTSLLTAACLVQSLKSQLVLFSAVVFNHKNKNQVDERGELWASRKLAQLNYWYS